MNNSTRDSKMFRIRYPLEAVSDTQNLQHKILSATQDLEQEIEQHPGIMKAPVRRGFFNIFGRPEFFAMAAASIAALTIALFLWSPSMTNVGSDADSSKNIAANTEATTNTEPPLSEFATYELEFQELLLSEDELLFAQL